MLFLAGCIEYSPLSNVPPMGVPNPRAIQATVQTDKLVQVRTPEVDVLWVVDNSCSMSEEQSAISMNNPVFMDFFLGSGLDYHIGVTSTDMNDSSHSGMLRAAAGVRWIDEDNPNPTGVFSAMIELGTSGSADERGRDAAYGALEVHRDGYNTGFLRDDASLHVVTVSDEDDHSDLSQAEFVDYVASLEWDPEMTTYSFIGGIPDVSACAAVVETGTQYVAVSDAIGGIRWDICEEQWAEVLELLGIQASGLRREYFLSELPIADSIEVWVVQDGVTYAFDRGTDWTYQSRRNSITFVEYIPTSLAEVFVRYEVLSANERG